MPPGVQLLLPAAVPAAAALLTWAAAAVSVPLGRYPAVVSAWLSVLALGGLWLPSRSAIELHGPSLGPVAAFGLRLDAVAFVFGLAVAVPAALLLTFQRRNGLTAAAAALALSAALLTVLADGVVLGALCLGTAATVLFVHLRTDSERGTEVYWPSVMAGWICLVWFGATLEVITKTSVYTAVPVTAMGSAGFLLLALAAALVSGLVPWRPWTSEMWDRPRLSSGAVATAVLLPIGPLLLFRAYEIGGGRWPSVWINFALAAAGVATALGAAARAQAAPTRRALLGESVPALGGVALTALALGTPAGAVAGMAAVLAAALAAALLPLLPDDLSLAPAAALALAAGVPPSLTFVALLLAIQAAIEAGDAWAFLGIGLALAWLVAAAACARGLRLPATGRGAEPGGSPRGSLTVAAAVLAMGALAGVGVTYVLLPAVLDVMTLPVAAVGGGRMQVTTVAGAWAAVALGGPAAGLLFAVAVASRAWPARAIRGAPAGPAPGGAPAGPAPGPLFSTGIGGWAERSWDRLTALRIPAEYRSLADPVALEAAMARGQPVLWAALVVVLAIAINR